MSILLSLALGLFSLKNLTLTYFYLVDDLPDLHPLMFADALVTAAILLRLLVSGTMGSHTKEDDNGSPQSDQELLPSGNSPTKEEPLTSVEPSISKGPTTPEEPPGV